MFSFHENFVINSSKESKTIGKEMRRTVQKNTAPNLAKKIIQSKYICRYENYECCIFVTENSKIQLLYVLALFFVCVCFWINTCETGLGKGELWQLPVMLVKRSDKNIEHHFICPPK